MKKFKILIIMIVISLILFSMLKYCKTLLERRHQYLSVAHRYELFADVFEGDRIKKYYRYHEYYRMLEQEYLYYADHPWVFPLPRPPEPFPPEIAELTD